MFFECRIVEMDKDGKRKIIAGISAIPVGLDFDSNESFHAVKKVFGDASWNVEHQDLDVSSGSDLTIQEILNRFPSNAVLSGITFSETDKEHAIFFRVKK